MLEAMADSSASKSYTKLELSYDDDIIWEVDYTEAGMAEVIIWPQGIGSNTKPAARLSRSR